MALKYFLLACLLVSAQASVGRPSVSDVQKDIDTELEKLLQKLLEAVEETVTEIRKIVKDLYDNLAEEAQAALDLALGQLVQAIKEFQQELEEIKENAAGLAGKAQECVNSERDNISNAQTTAVSGIKACNDGIKGEAEEALKAIAALVDETIEAVNGLKDEWETCTNILCQGGVVGKIPQVYSKAMDNVQEAIKVVKEYIPAQWPSYRSCVGGVLNKYVAERSEIQLRILDCINAIGSQ